MTRRAVLLAVVLALTGAGVGAIAVAGQSPVAAIADPAAAPAQQWRRDTVYLAQARRLDVQASEGALLGTARDVCHQLDTGHPRADLVADMSRHYRISAVVAADLVAAAVQSRCPQHGRVLTVGAW